MNNILYIISGCSGSGKTTLMKNVMDNELISYTTRQPRMGESQGNPYYFISDEEYQEMFDDNKFAEWSNYAGHGYRYAVTHEEMGRKLKKSDAYVISDYNGMKQFKNAYPNCKSIYIYVSKEDAEKQMRIRGDKEELIQKRLSTYDEEISNLIYYDHVIINQHGEMEETISKIKDIIGVVT